MLGSATTAMKPATTIVRFPVTGKQEPVYELQKAAEEAGLPQAVIALMPAITLAFGVSGFPAFATAVFSAISGAAYGQKKMREFAWQVEGELGRIEADSMRSNEKLNDEIADLRERLEESQLEDLSELFEHWMRTSDEEWLRHLRAAIRGTVTQRVERANRKAIIAALRMLGPAHVNHLNLLAKSRPLADRVLRRSSSRDHWGWMLTPELKAVRAVLVAVGFARYEVSVDEDPMAGRAPSHFPKSRIGGHDNVAITQLGYQALDMLLEDQNPGSEE